MEPVRWKAIVIALALGSIASGAKAETTAVDQVLQAEKSTRLRIPRARVLEMLSNGGYNCQLDKAQGNTAVYQCEKPINKYATALQQLTFVQGRLFGLHHGYALPTGVGICSEKRAELERYFGKRHGNNITWHRGGVTFDYYRHGNEEHEVCYFGAMQ